MERKLDVRFAELDLLPAAGRPGVEDTGILFYRELSVGCRGLDLLDQLRIAPCEKAVLSGREVPPLR